MSDISWHHQIGSEDFPAEPNRYHLYIGWFCPFAHRATLARELKGLQSLISLSVLKPFPKDDDGFQFPATEDEVPGSQPNPFHPEDKFLKDVYFRSPPSYDEYPGKYSVPVLWDSKTEQIVNNESLEILRMLNHAFDKIVDEDDAQKLDLYPEHLRAAIDQIDAWLIPGLNTGVYGAAFAKDQASYDTASKTVFDSLDQLEKLLAEHNKPFILAQQLTDADIKAFTTLIRFDTVYHQQFKLNIRSIRHDYPAIHRWMKNLYWNCRGFKDTTNFRHIRDGYAKAFAGGDASSIVPAGPVPDVEAWTDEDERWRKTWVGSVEWPARRDWKHGRTFA